MNSLKTAPYNITDDGDGMKSNYDDLSSDFINKAKKILEQKRFVFPDEKIFNQRVLDVFHFNLKEYQNSIIALRPAMFPEVAIRKSRFIFIQDAGAEEPEFINPELLYHFNSYIFNKSEVSFVWLMANAQDVLFDLVRHYGYNEDKKLVEIVFSKFDFNSLSDVEELIFTDSNKKMLKKQMFDDIESIVYKGSVEDFSYAKKGNGYIRIGEIIDKISSSQNDFNNPQEIISYLFERELRVGIQGDIESYMNRYPQYKSSLEKNNFYDLPKLKDYVEYIYQSNNQNQDITNYIVSDPDGYTNLRKEKNTNSEILQKVKSGDEVEVLNNSGDWSQVKTKDGKVGYIHKSRLKSLKNSVSVLQIYSRPDFNSFSQEIKPKNEVEYIHKVSGWDFIRVDDRVGYLPPQGQMADVVKTERKKHSFLANDEPLQEKKKGFWDRLFG